MEPELVKAVVDLDAIAHNASALKAMTPAKTALMAVVKADGYGHGAVPVAKKALENGATWLGVARFEEAVELRNAGISEPILVFGYVESSRVKKVLNFDLRLTAYDLQMAQAFSDEATRLSKKLTLHLKMDTGMGRVGTIVPELPENQQIVVNDILAIQQLPGIALEGIYTHFAAADEKDKSYTRVQLDRFQNLLNDLKRMKVEIPIRHLANSAGIIEFPQSHFDMVRAGISLYGFYPSADVNQTKVDLLPAMTLKSIVTAVRDVPKGFNVSYGMTHKTSKATRLASVPIGYADGYSRAFTNNGYMLVKGQRAPIVGRVCMDQTMIDVGHIPDVKRGDEVVIFGCQKDEILSADELAGRIQTINYEIVSALTRRVARVYSESGSG